MEAVKYKIHGIKCDNPDCDFTDMTVKFKDYPAWLNRPCPKCGANLLTEADLRTIKSIIKIVNIVNVLARPFVFLLKKQVKVKVEMNGTGQVNFKRIKEG